MIGIRPEDHLEPASNANEVGEGEDRYSKRGEKGYRTQKQEVVRMSRDRHQVSSPSYRLLIEGKSQ